MNDLDKYKQIQRRTKLLYGVSDVKRMIGKSDTSQHFYQNDIIYQKENNQRKTKEKQYHEKDKSAFKKFKDLFKLDYLIISMSNPYKALFDNIILIVIGYTCLTTVLFISFDSQKSEMVNNIDYAVTACFAIDIILNLMMEYQDKETF